MEHALEQIGGKITRQTATAKHELLLKTYYRTHTYSHTDKHKRARHNKTMSQTIAPPLLRNLDDAVKVIDQYV
jgi:hypothetical protein